MRLKPFLIALPLLATLLFLGAARGADDTGPTLTVVPLHGPTTQWTVPQLEALPGAKEFPYTSHAQPHTGRGLPLLDLLQAAGVPTDFEMEEGADPKAKNYLLRVVLVVQANDGYTVSFSLAELFPDVGHRTAWVAFDVDGKPLSGQAGPARLIVPEDKLPARSVRGVIRLSVVDPTPSTQP